MAAAPDRLTAPETYRAYLLRFTRANADQPWALVAKDVETGEEYPLADVEALVAFLTARVPNLRLPERRPPAPTNR